MNRIVFINGNYVEEKDAKIQHFAQQVDQMESTIGALEGKLSDLEKNMEVIDTNNSNNKKIDIIAWAVPLQSNVKSHVRNIRFFLHYVT